MGKEKKPKLGIKTSRYYTKKCDKCNSEYPNWFTNCPNCGAAWDETKERQSDGLKIKKNIKIVVKITEEDFNETIKKVKLVFSADQGEKWYQIYMDSKMDYFIAEIAEVPVGSVIVYYIEVNLDNGSTYIENNGGNYFYYKVGLPSEESKDIPSESEVKYMEEKMESSREITQEHKETPKRYENAKIEYGNDITILGKPQTQIDPNLKVCPHCNSRIKKMWSVCPFCGGRV
ncbi:MAG: hypothetical protein EU539_05105 [Promethearchaeota archaeon]|nr:MAG: hypothetical protein EU539_05105 [Candidatus Lokiarchaeota archaeon]